MKKENRHELRLTPRQAVILFGVLGVIFLLLTTLTLYLLFRPKPVFSNPPGTIGNTAGNLNNGGLFCEYDGTVYFSNSFLGGVLCTMTPDEEHLQVLSNAMAQCILAGGENVYYFQAGVFGEGDISNIASQHGMMRYDIRKKKTSLLSEEVVVTGQLMDDYLYLMTLQKKKTELIKIRGDKTDKVVLTNYVLNPACVRDGFIYYNNTLEDNNLYSLDAADIPRRVTDISMYFPIAEGNWIYYMDIYHNYRLCRYNLSSEEIEVLTDDRVDCFNVGSGYIYYQKNGKDACLKCMRTDGSDVFTLLDGNYCRINMTSRYVYFQDFESHALFHANLGASDARIFAAAQELTPKQ